MAEHAMVLSPLGDEMSYTLSRKVACKTVSQSGVVHGVWPCKEGFFFIGGPPAPWIKSPLRRRSLGASLVLCRAAANKE